MLRKVASITLGCAKNQVDTEFMLGALADSDYVIVDEPETADAIVINSCCFIDAAKEETVNTILGAVNIKMKRPGVKIIVVGCACQKYGQELLREIPEIDALLGIGQLKELVNVLDNLRKSNQEQPITIIEENPKEDEITSARWGFSWPAAYLKIAEGCNKHCTYCVIPQIRGPYRSRTIEGLVQEANHLANNGVRELTLVAQDITAYGLDLYGELKLPKLLQELTRIEKLKWIRLLYCYPTYITEELLAVIAQEEKICRYMDIPLQHADSRILRAMGRKGNREFVEGLIQKIRGKIPDIALRTTFIVGFPGETEGEFQSILDFIETQRFQWAGIFTYSQEKGTLAYDMEEQIPMPIKEERYHRAMLLQREITLAYNYSFVGKSVSVLVEGIANDLANHYVGRTQWQAPDVDGLVYFPITKEIKPGEFAKVQINSVAEYDLIGELIK